VTEGFRSPEDETVGLSRTATWGGLETKVAYGPGDTTALDYERDLGDPGSYPFTRGSFPHMYRSRMWTLRNIVGYGAPEDTRDGVTRSLAMGATGVDVAVDNLTAEENEISYKRRVLHGKIDILRAELVNRLRQKRERGDSLISGDDVEQLTNILAGRAQGEDPAA